MISHYQETEDKDWKMLKTWKGSDQTCGEWMNINIGAVYILVQNEKTESNMETPSAVGQESSLLGSPWYMIFATARCGPWSPLVSRFRRPPGRHSPRPAGRNSEGRCSCAFAWLSGPSDVYHLRESYAVGVWVWSSGLSYLQEWVVLSQIWPIQDVLHPCLNLELVFGHFWASSSHFYPFLERYTAMICKILVAKSWLLNRITQKTVTPSSRIGTCPEKISGL